MNNFNQISALRFAKYKADKKYIKKLSNAFSVPLVLEQVFANVIFIIVGIMVMLIRISVLHEFDSFNFATFLDFLAQSDTSDCLNNIAYALTYFSYMSIPLVLIAAVLRQNPFRRIPMKVRRPDLILPSIVIGLALSVIGLLYSSYFEYLLSSFNLEVNLPQSDFPNNVPALIFYVIEISVFAPILEELIFRGMILQNLRKYGDFFAILVSSILFAFLHGNFSQTPFAFVVGLALGFTVIETGSIFICILLHCCVNTISTIISGIGYYYGDDIANITYFIYAVVIIALAVFIIIRLKKKNFFKGIKERYFSETMPVPHAFAIFAKTPGFIIFVSIYGVLMLLTLKIM